MLHGVRRHQGDVPSIETFEHALCNGPVQQFDQRVYCFFSGSQTRSAFWYAFPVCFLPMRRRSPTSHGVKNLWPNGCRNVGIDSQSEWSCKAWNRHLVYRLQSYCYNFISEFSKCQSNSAAQAKRRAAAQSGAAKLSYALLPPASNCWNLELFFAHVLLCAGFLFSSLVVHCTHQISSTDAHDFLAPEPLANSHSWWNLKSGNRSPIVLLLASDLVSATSPNYLSK